MHVTGVTDDGYHLLESLVAFADVGDRLRFRQSEAFALSIDGPFSAGLDVGADNLIAKAAQLLGFAKVDITLSKELPIASGIGGGSSDAAATLRGLSALSGKPMPYLSDQLKLGADVPVCVYGRACHMSGIGERVQRIDLSEDLFAVLVNPGHPVATAEVFKALKAKENSAHNFQETVSLDDIARYRNDLQAPAIALCPEIEQALDALRSEHAHIARMSGSGATCFGLFDSLQAAQSAEKSISGHHPSWWVKATTLS